MRAVSALAIVLVLLTPGPLPLQACGDKFLFVGRGATYGRVYASIYPGRITIYLRDSARAADRTSGLRKVLTDAGHRVSVVSGDGLSETLQRGRTDIVIADAIESTAIDAQLTHVVSKPTTLYVLMDKDRKRHGAGKATFPLKQSDKARRWLEVIEDAMQARAQSGTRVKERSTQQETGLQ